MKNIYLLIFYLFFTLLCHAQLSSNSGKTYTTFAGVDYLFVYNGINSSTEISYNGSETDVKWYKYSDLVTPFSNQNPFSPDYEDAEGYVLMVDGAIKYTFWVIDYSRFLPSFTSFAVDPESENACDNVRLLLDANIPQLYYKNSSGQTFNIDNSYTIEYQTSSWVGDAWNTIDTTFSVEVPASYFDVPAPLVYTTFKLTANNRFARDLGITPQFIETSTFMTKAVKNKLTTITSIRDAENEDQRPSTDDVVSGSAPLDILFKANPTQGVTHNQWSIYKNDEFVLTRIDENHRYTFSDYGSYKVVLVSNSETCIATDSVTIDVSESALEVPNVFTPNGDGIHDEFRVAYRSLKSFDIVVYNRWGNKVYQSSDPQRGWDGTIGGKQAASSAYFYVIKAEGNDGVKYNLKGDINLIR